MSQPNVASVTVTFRPTVLLGPLKAALKTMEGEQRRRIIRQMLDMLRSLESFNR